MNRVEYAGAIADVRFDVAGAGGFDLLVGTAVYLSSDDISGKTVFAVQGTDETHIYAQVDGGAVIDANDIQLVAVLNGTTNTTDLVAGNFI